MDTLGNLRTSSSATDSDIKTRLYTQLDTTSTGEIAQARQASDDTFKESGGRVDTDSITADEVLAQANKIFAPYTLKFAAPLSWFAVWKISERVARSFSSPDLRVHLSAMQPTCIA